VSAPLQGQAVIYLGSNATTFKKRFGQMDGFVCSVNSSEEAGNEAK